MKKLTFIFISILFLNIYSANSQGFFKKKKKNKNKVELKESNSENSIAKKTIDCIKYDGLFCIYQSKKDGKSFIEIDQNQINDEFIYFSYVEDGVVDSWNFRGGFRGYKIIKIKKYFNKIDFIVENTKYYFDPSSPLSKSSKANINDPLVISEEIIASNDDSKIFN